MRHRLLLLFLLICLIPGISFAQTKASATFTVKGVLIDSVTNQGEPYATLKIVKKNAPDKPLKMAVTDNKGKFQEKIPASAGEYVLTLSSIGRATIVKDFTYKDGEKEIDLGTLYSVEAANDLKGIEVVAQRPLVKVDVDKIEYNVKDDPDSKTNSVMEMLRKVPLVTVDGEDNIKVNGSSSFKIHLNGKPNNMMSDNPKDVLKSIPAHTIKSIEVKTNPGVKYDAEGVGGILNIVTEGRGFEGYMLTVSARASNTGFGGGAYGTVQKGKFTTTGNYSYNYNNSPRGYNDSYQENYQSDKEKYLYSNNSNKGKGSNHYGSLEASYELDTLRLFTMSVSMWGGTNNSTGNGLTRMLGSDQVTKAYSYATNSRSHGSRYSVRGNLDYQRSFSVKERLLTFSYNISTQPSNNDSYMHYDDRDGDWEKLQIFNRRNDGNTNTLENTFQVDYSTPIGKLHTIETGLKYINRNNTSDNRIYEAGTTAADQDNYLYNADRSSKYQHLSHIAAAYLGYALKYKKFTFKPGVRYEYTYQQVKYFVGKGENFNANFNDLVPSVSLGFKLDDTQSIRGGYNMRIWRPSIYYLNPYFDDSSPMSIRQGNPDLKSEKSHSFNIGYSNYKMKWGFSASVYHSFNNNSIEHITRIVGENEKIDGHEVTEGALYTKPFNIGKSRNTSLGLSGNLNPVKNMRIYLNIDGGYSDMKSPAQGLHNYGWAGSLYGNLQYTFPWKIRTGLYGGGSTGWVSLQGTSSGYQFYGLNINRSFLKEDRLSVGLYANNFLKKFNEYSGKTYGANFYSTYDSKYASRNFGINVSWRFGELKANVKKAQRSISNDDVKSSGGSGGGGGQ